MDMEKMVNLCKQYGFIFQGSEIYGGLANTWDYGPLGSRLKNNVKDAWRKRFIQERDNAYELDADILMHPMVWKASGHVDSFADPLIDCRECKTRHRADNLINDFSNSSIGDAMTNEEMIKYINENKVPCPKCGKTNFTNIRQFKLMFETYRGVTQDSKSVVYLRPENAQGEYVNFLNVQRSMRAKLPFSIGQIGKAFRNEITPGNFTFRTIEFEQMEYQTFCKKGDDMNLYEYFKQYGKKFYMDLGIKEEHLDPDTNTKYIPYIIESTYGLDRTVLALLFEAYEVVDDREVLKLHPYLAPYKVAVLPLIKKNHSEKAKEIYQLLSKNFMTNYDEAGNIGKRYRRNDVIGTPFCVTIDDETINNNTVTIRERDTMEQTTINVSELVDYIEKRIKF